MHQADPISPSRLEAELATVSTEPDQFRSPQTHVWFGRSLIVGATILWSASGFFAKAPIFESWPLEQRPFLLTFWRALFASAFLLLFVRRITFTWRLIPMVVAFASMSATYMSAMVYAEATLAIWLQYTAPIWVLLAGTWIFREPAKRIDIVFLTIALTGVGWMIAFQLVEPGNVGLWFGLASGFFFAFVVLLIRSLRDLDIAWLVFVNQFSSAIVMAPFVFFRKDVYFPVDEQWLYLIAFGVLQMGIPYVLFARGVRSVISHEASGLLLLEPILVPIWVFLAWRHVESYQSPDWSTWFGAGLILSSLVMRYGYDLRLFRRWRRTRTSPL